MTTIVFLTVTILFITGCTKTQTPHFDNVEQKEVFELMVNAFNHEVEKFNSYSNKNTWPNTTFFIGAMVAYHTTGYRDFLSESYQWAEDNNWKLRNRNFHADDQAAAQVYLALFKVFREYYMISEFLSEAESMAHTERNENLLWWWADALFMAPPALIELSSITDGNKFLNYTNKEWNKTYNLLYNKEDSLFYRDERYKSGRKIYWLRGNGWVVAGLAKILNILTPKDHFYQRYMNIYHEMIDKLITLQSDDGLWRSALLRPKEFPIPETSGSALVCYALGWGVNNKTLRGATYENALLNCWRGLKSKVNSFGRLQGAQPVGHRPVHFSPNNSEVFGSGAFLLAASEVFKFKGN